MAAFAGTDPRSGIRCDAGTLRKLARRVREALFSKYGVHGLSQLEMLPRQTLHYQRVLRAEHSMSIPRYTKQQIPTAGRRVGPWSHGPSSPLQSIIGAGMELPVQPPASAPAADSRAQGGHDNVFPAAKRQCRPATSSHASEAEARRAARSRAVRSGRALARRLAATVHQ